MKDGKISSVAVDFDGTCVTDEFPGIGKPIGAVPVLKLMESKGIKIMLNTVRDGLSSLDAANWLKKEGITLWGLNRNPTQFKWSKSPKVHADLFIDDRSVGVPLINGEYVDWIGVLDICVQHGYLGDCTLEELETVLEEIQKQLNEI